MYMYAGKVKGSPHIELQGKHGWNIWDSYSQLCSFEKEEKNEGKKEEEYKYSRCTVQ